MPLSPSDLHFLDRVLNRELESARHWSWLRWVFLGFGVLLLLQGVYAFQSATKYKTLMSEGSPPPLASRPALVTSTQPVTEAQLATALESAHEYNRLALQQNTMLISNIAMLWCNAILNSLFGAVAIIVALGRWNHYRRNALLITLLREKYVPELKPSSPHV